MDTPTSSDSEEATSSDSEEDLQSQAGALALRPNEQLLCDQPVYPNIFKDVKNVAFQNYSSVLLGDKNSLQVNLTIPPQDPQDIEYVTDMIKETIFEYLNLWRNENPANRLPNDHGIAWRVWNACCPDGSRVKQIVFYFVTALLGSIGLAYVCLAIQMEVEKLWFSDDKLSADAQEEQSTNTVHFVMWIIGCSQFVVMCFLIKNFTTRKRSGIERDTYPEHSPFAPRMKGRDFWLASPPTVPLDENTLPVRRVIIIHTATDDHLSSPQNCDLIRQIQMVHMESRKWFDIGYNFLIGGDGVVYIGRGWDKVGAHTQGFNDGSLGVAFVGTYTTKMPQDSQLTALKKLLDLGVRIKKIKKKYKLNFHCQFQNTASPGAMLVRRLRSWPHFDSSLPILTPEN